jgi:hypothetical protein
MRFYYTPLRKIHRLILLKIYIKDDGEDNVTKLTYENVWKEVKDIPGVELVVREHWEVDSKHLYTCWLESDCLVGSGYFETQLGLFKKNPMFRKLSMLTPSVSVNDWANKFYGYSSDSVWSDEIHKVQTKNHFIKPNKERKSTAPYPVQIGYVPGAIIRTPMLIKALRECDFNNSWEKDLVYLSMKLSFAFWRMGDGNPVYVNPNAAYCTTDDTVNDIGKFQSEAGDLIGKFQAESI